MTLSSRVDFLEQSLCPPTAVPLAVVEQDTSGRVVRLFVSQGAGWRERPLDSDLSGLAVVRRLWPGALAELHGGTAHADG